MQLKMPFLSITLLLLAEETVSGGIVGWQSIAFFVVSNMREPINFKIEEPSSVLEITVGHRTLSDQILKMSGQFHIMIGHDDRTCHQHILSCLLQGVVSQ